MGDLERDTRVTRITEDGRFEATISEDWTGFGINGGYLSAMALRAVGTLSDQRPISYAGHYLSTSAPGPVILHVERLRQSSKAESFSVRLVQEDRPVLTALVRTAAAGSGLEHDVTRVPVVPPPKVLAKWDDLVPVEERKFPMMANFDMRPVTWGDEWPPLEAEEPIHLAWLRFRPTPVFVDPFCEAGRSVVLLDSFVWPCVERAHFGNPSLFARSLDLSVSFHAAGKHSEWLLAETRVPLATGGLIAGNGRVWDKRGRLVASGLTNMLCLG